MGTQPIFDVFRAATGCAPATTLTDSERLLLRWPRTPTVPKGYQPRLGAGRSAVPPYSTGGGEVDTGGGRTEWGDTGGVTSAWEGNTGGGQSASAGSNTKGSGATNGVGGGGGGK